jgi:hypothetical protein
MKLFLLSSLAITTVSAVDVHDDPSLTYNYVTLADWGDDSRGQVRSREER